jgi:phenylacetic acid degradation operon negative regulatory protein
MPHPLARIIEHLKREPSRTGSIVVILFGDAIVPRGGSVWASTDTRSAGDEGNF